MNFLFSVLLLQTITSASAAPELFGRAVTIQGQVFIRSDGQSSVGGKPLHVGDEIHSGDVINSGSDGFAKILGTDRTILDLGPSSLLKIDEYMRKNVKDRRVALSLKFGKLRTSVNEKVGETGTFRVRSGGSTMGVRGTEFLIANTLPTQPGSAVAADGSGGTLSVTVMGGTVAVSQESRSTASTGSPTLLNSGMRMVSDYSNRATPSASATTSTANSTSNVSSLSQSEMKEARSEAVVSDTTFSANVEIKEQSSNQSENRGPAGNGPQGQQGGNGGPAANAPPPAIMNAINTTVSAGIGAIAAADPIPLPPTTFSPAPPIPQPNPANDIVQPGYQSVPVTVKFTY